MQTNQTLLPVSSSFSTHDLGIVGPGLPHVIEQHHLLILLLLLCHLPSTSHHGFSFVPFLLEADSQKYYISLQATF
jgi:hypothetical protein